jgi:hypothetical protein
MKRILLVLTAAVVSLGYAHAQKSVLEGGAVAKKVKKEGVEMISANINDFRNKVKLPLSELAEKIEIVRLETRNEALFQWGNVVLSDNYIGMVCSNPKAFKLFDRKGKYLRDIGREGRGPNEYGNIYSAAIDEKSQTIYILPWQATQLLVFGMDGTHKEPIKLAHRAGKGVFTVNADGTFSFAVVPIGGAPVWAWTQDKTGKVINEIAAPAGRRMDFSSEIAAGRNAGGFDPFVMMYGNTDNDVLCNYDIRAGKMVPLFTVENIQSKKPPFYGYTQLPRHFIGNYAPGMGETRTDARGNTSSTSLPPVHFIVDRKTLQGAQYDLVIDELGGLGAWPNFSQGCFIYNAAAVNLKDKLEKLLSGGKIKDPAVKKRVTDLNNSIKEEDNNVVMIAKLKK